MHIDNEIGQAMQGGRSSALSNKQAGKEKTLTTLKWGPGLCPMHLKQAWTQLHTRWGERGDPIRSRWARTRAQTGLNPSSQTCASGQGEGVHTVHRKRGRRTHSLQIGNGGTEGGVNLTLERRRDQAQLQKRAGAEQRRCDAPA